LIARGNPLHGTCFGRRPKSVVIRVADRLRGSPLAPRSRPHGSFHPSRRTFSNLNEARGEALAVWRILGTGLDHDRILVLKQESRFSIPLTGCCLSSKRRAFALQRPRPIDGLNGSMMVPSRHHHRHVSNAGVARPKRRPQPRSKHRQTSDVDALGRSLRGTA